MFTKLCISSDIIELIRQNFMQIIDNYNNKELHGHQIYRNLLS